MKRCKDSAWILCCLALSCGGAAPSPGSGKHPPSRAEASTRHTASSGESTEKRAHRADESAPSTPEPKTVATPESDDRKSGTASAVSIPYRLPLPRNEAFLRAPLPERAPERYQTWKQELSLAVGQSHLYYASFVDEERTILVQSGADGAVRVYDRESRRLLAQHDFGTQDFEPAFVSAWEPLPGSPTAAKSYFALATKTGVSLHEAKSGFHATDLLDGAVGSLRLSADKSLLMTTSEAGENATRLSFFLREEPFTLSALGNLHFPERLDAWDLSRDNRFLAGAFYPSEDLLVYDLHSGGEVVRIKAPKYAASVAFSPDGRWLAVGGNGLLLIDLANPERRAFYSYFYNNINTVAFSPSGDAVAASSYDGHIRIFHHESSGPSLSLVRTLRHNGRANVYRIQFGRAGEHLLSASGDQTVRIFGNSRRPPSANPEQSQFRDLKEWRAKLPESERARQSTLRETTDVSRYQSPLLEETARPSRIAPGRYACRITSIYKLRDCTVTRTSSGHTLLHFHEGNLLELSGVLYDDGPVIRYEAWEPQKGSVVDCHGCERQPLHGIFRGTGRNFSGLLTFRSYFDPNNPPPLPAPDVKIEEANDRFPMSLEFRGPLPPTKDGAPAATGDGQPLPP